MKLLNQAILLSVVFGVVGCSNSRSDYVAEQIKQIKNATPIEAEPVPAATNADFYMYSGQSFRSPFIPPSLANALSKNGKQTLMPDLNRPKTPLEEIALDQLLFKGTISDKVKGSIALIQTPDGVVHRVQAGAYLGVDFGRIVSISPEVIKLVEIVPNANEGYVERPRQLVVAGKQP